MPGKLEYGKFKPALSDKALMYNESTKQATESNFHLLPNGNNSETKKT